MRREAVLPAREAAFSADVLEKDEAAAGLQHPPHLGERRRGLSTEQRTKVTTAVSKCRIGEGQRLGASPRGPRPGLRPQGRACAADPPCPGSGSTATTRVARS